MTQQKESNSRVKVPAKAAPSSTVDVSLKHILIGFAVLFTGTAVTFSGIAILRDFAKYKRQKALLGGAMELVKLLKEQGGNHAQK